MRNKRIIIELIVLGLLLSWFVVKHRTATSQTVRTPVSSSARRVLKYSLIPGGFDTIEELRNIAVKDSLIHEILKNFRWRSARIFALPSDINVYVSFRTGGVEFWTKHRLLIPAGALVISDGSITLLLRCGNRIAWALPEPSVDLPPTELEEPEPNPILQEFEPVLPFPSDVFPDPGLVGGVFPAPGMPLYVPENPVYGWFPGGFGILGGLGLAEIASAREASTSVLFIFGFVCFGIYFYGTRSNQIEKR